MSEVITHNINIHFDSLLPNEGDYVEYDGKRLPANIDYITHQFSLERIPFDRQIFLLRNFINQYPDLNFCKACRDAILERLAFTDEISALDTQLSQQPHSTHTKRPTQIASDTACERQFVFIGKNTSTAHDMLRNWVYNLAENGFIPSDHSEDKAMLRILGLRSNDSERNSKPPFVHWKGKQNSLHYLIDLLHEAQMIRSDDSNHTKWITTCGAFLINGNCRIAPDAIANNRNPNDKTKQLILRCLPGIKDLIGKNSR